MRHLLPTRDKHCNREQKVNGCLRCGRCCTRFGVCVTPFDILRISRKTGLPPEEFVFALPEPRKHKRKEAVVLIDGKRCLIILKWKNPVFWVFKGRICFFYSGNGCSIYEERPMLCRTYPFIHTGKTLSDLKSRPCPQLWMPDSKGREQYAAALEQYEKEIIEYNKIAEEWNRGPGGDLKAFLKFVLERVR